MKILFRRLFINESIIRYKTDSENLSHSLKYTIRFRIKRAQAVDTFANKNILNCQLNKQTCPHKMMELHLFITFQPKREFYSYRRKRILTGLRTTQI